MGIKKTYDEVLSNPNLIKESREMKELIDKVWNSEELLDKDFKFFEFAS